MAAANILTSAATDASSSDQTVASDTVYGLKGGSAGARVRVELKDDTGAYNLVTYLTPEDPVKVLSPGTWRFTRIGGISCGVYSA